MLRPARNPLLQLALLAMAAGQVAARGQSRTLSPATSTVPTESSPAPVVLDSVVAVINGDVILESDVQEEMRFAVLQPARTGPARDTAQSALRRLIDRDLILQQMKATRAGTPPPRKEEVQHQLTELRKQIPECAQYHCETEAGWDAFLAAHGLTQKEVEDRWRQRIRILSFIQARFGAGVRISRPDVEQYYQKNFAPEFAKRHVQPPPLDSVSARIREVLLQQEVNVLLQNWLQSLKAEGTVSILGPAYAELGSSSAAQKSTGGR